MSSLVFVFPLSIDGFLFYVDGLQKEATLCIRQISTNDVYYCRLVNISSSYKDWIEDCFRYSVCPFSEEEQHLFEKWATMPYIPSILGNESSMNWTIAMDTFVLLRGE